MNERNEKKFNEKVKGIQNHSEEERNPLDKFKDQQFVDDIPLEELKIEAEQEANKEKSQTTSQSEKKYKADSDKDE